MTAFIVAGTDTDVGKTVFAAMLTLALGGIYWKPIQSGIADGTDRATVASLTRLDASHFLPERFVLTEPLSPHRAAELDGITITASDLLLPDDVNPDRPLIIEGAGGLLVPVNRQVLFIDILRSWSLPVILCARTRLGTINHSLLSVEALRRRDIPILGIAFIGDEIADTEQTIIDFAKVKRLGRLPWLEELTPAALMAAFEAKFNRADFRIASEGTMP
jgi:dethiobiotin synthetase